LHLTVDCCRLIGVIPLNPAVRGAADATEYPILLHAPVFGMFFSALPEKLKTAAAGDLAQQ